MKKIIKILLTLILFFVLTQNVKASEVKCYYGSPGFKVAVIYSTGSSLSVYRDWTNSSYQYTSLGDSYVKLQDLMKPDGTLYCPDELYYEQTGSVSAIYKVSFTSASLTINHGYFPLIVAESSVVNDPIDPNNPEENVRDTFCSYGKNSMIFNTGKGTVSYYLYGVNSNIPVVGPSFSSLAAYNYECPDKFCFYCNTRESQRCDISFTEGALMQCITKGTWEEHEEENNRPPYPEIPNDPIEGAEGTIKCDAFKKLTDPLWKWMRIIAPILAVTLGTMDLLKAVASDDEKAIKKSVGDFGKRLGLTALLFLLPYVVGILVGLAGYGDSMACL